MFRIRLLLLWVGGKSLCLHDDENVAVWLDLLGGEVGSTRARQAKERENAEKAAAGTEGDPPATEGDAMQTD